jgi:rare lipoprotein A
MRRLQRYGFGASLGVLCAVSVSACATIEPKYATRPDLGPDQPRASNQPSGAGGAYKVGKPYQVRGQWYYPAEQPDYDETGIASWYGDAFNGKPTANGEIFDMHGLSAAHKTLPLPSLVEVTNLDNGRSMQLRVNDRGPFVDDRIIDLSRGAAEELGVLRPGLARVRVRYVGRADIPGQGRVTIARATPPAPVLPPPAPLAPQPAPVEMAAAEPVITQTELAPLEAPVETAPPVVEAARRPPIAFRPAPSATGPTPNGWRPSSPTRAWSRSSRWSATASPSTASWSATSPARARRAWCATRWFRSVSPTHGSFTRSRPLRGAANRPMWPACSVDGSSPSKAGRGPASRPRSAAWRNA